MSHLLRSAPAHKPLFGTEVAREVLAGPRLRLVPWENAARLFRGR